MDLLKLIDQNVECVATPNGRYLKRSEVFEVVEKFTSTNTGSPKLPSEPELIRYIESNASHIEIDHAQSVYRWLARQLRASA